MGQNYTDFSVIYTDLATLEDNYAVKNLNENFQQSHTYTRKELSD